MFKKFETNTLVYALINTSKEKLQNFKAGLDLYLTDLDLSDEHEYNKGVKAYIDLVKFVIDNYEKLVKDDMISTDIKSILSSIAGIKEDFELKDKFDKEINLNALEVMAAA